MKSPSLKVIDFDSVVKNTKVAKSIILMRDLSNGSRRLGEMLLRFSVFGYIEIRNFFIIYGEEKTSQL